MVTEPQEWVCLSPGIILLCSVNECGDLLMNARPKSNNAQTSVLAEPFPRRAGCPDQNNTLAPDPEDDSRPVPD